MKDRKVLRSLMMLTQVGITMLVPVFLCARLGYLLMRKFDNEIWFLLMLILGVGAAFRNLFLLTKSFYAKDLEREAKERDYIEGLKKYSGEHPDEDFSDVMERKKKRYPENKGPTRS